MPFRLNVVSPNVVFASMFSPLLQNRQDAFISTALSLEPGRICMIMSYLQIAPARPKPDACFAF
jgi:hypothetical protein